MVATTNSPLFTFIHASFNSSAFTIGCIESILNCDSHAEIIIVDNNSNSSEKAKLTTWMDEHEGAIPNVHILFEPMNLGYFGALNAGLRYIREKLSLSKYVIIGNNDLVFETSFFEELRRYQSEDGVYAIAPDIINNVGIHQNPYALKETAFNRKLLHKIFYSNYLLARLILFGSSILKVKQSTRNRRGFEVSQRIFAGHGSCYVLTKSYFSSNNFLDNSSFLMGEEFIFARQIQKSGGHIQYLANLKVKHVEHSSIKKMPSRVVYRYMKEAYEIIKEYY